MTIRKIRRTYGSYGLPSESRSLLQSLVGHEVKSMKTGVTHTVTLDGRSISESKPVSELTAEQNGHGAFLTLDDGRTIDFQFEESTDSIVLREVAGNIDDQSFLDDLHRDGTYIVWFMRYKKLVATPGSKNIVGKKIRKVFAYKFPDNFRMDPVRSVHPCEAAIVLAFTDDSDCVITPGLEKGRMPSISISVLPGSALRQGDAEKPDRIWESR